MKLWIEHDDNPGILLDPELSDVAKWLEEHHGAEIQTVDTDRMQPYLVVADGTYLVVRLPE